MKELFIEALKIEYRKGNPGKPATLNRVHFSNWVIDKLYDIANEMDDDAFYEFKYDYIENASPALKKKLKKYFED